MGLAEDMQKLNDRLPDRYRVQRDTLWARFDVLLAQHFGYLRYEITRQSQDNYASYRNHLAAIKTVFLRDIGKGV